MVHHWKKSETYADDIVFRIQWIRIDSLDRAQGAGSQEICQWMARSLSLGNPTKKYYKEWKKTIYPLEKDTS